MIKTGKKWVILALIYILFDFPGAMPYNYLFFHEKLKAQNGFDVDLKEYKKQLENTSTLMAPFIDSLVKKRDADSINKKDIDTAIKEMPSKIKSLDVKRDEWQLSKLRKEQTILKNTLKIFKLNYNKLKAEINSAMEFKRLDSYWTDSIVNLSIKRTARIQAMNEFKREFKSFTDKLIIRGKESEIKVLREKIKNIDPIQQTQLEVIEDLYTYTKNLVGIKTKKELTPEDNNFIEMCL